MKQFTDEAGQTWIATAREEDTPRHHGRWYLVLQPADINASEMVLAEVRWQTRQSAERTLRTMSEFELRRRLRMAAGRNEVAGGVARNPFGDWKPGAPGSSGVTA